MNSADSIAAAPSLESIGVTHEAAPAERCQNGLWFRGNCDDHGNIRWVWHPCKKRRCPVCGPKRRQKVAARIAHGIDQLAGPRGATWFVGTWAEDVTKEQAVKAATRFVAWVRRHQPKRTEYASTWELTKKGRLHINFIFAPWQYIHFTTLSAAWARVSGGSVVWVKRVGPTISKEVAKTSQDVADYITKQDQMPPYGKAATYSRGWPKPPAEAPLVRRGKIRWQPETTIDSFVNGVSEFTYERELGYWHENEDGEYFNDQDTGCNCFDFIPPGQRQRLPGRTAGSPGPTIPPVPERTTRQPAEARLWGAGVGWD